MTQREFHFEVRVCIQISLALSLEIFMLFSVTLLADGMSYFRLSIISFTFSGENLWIIIYLCTELLEISSIKVQKWMKTIN